MQLWPAQLPIHLAVTLQTLELSGTFPNNPSLPYQRTRGTDPGRVILNRNSESTLTGIFRCDIPDASGVLQSLYVGIYTSTTGE